MRVTCQGERKKHTRGEERKRGQKGGKKRGEKKEGRKERKKNKIKSNRWNIVNKAQCAREYKTSNSA